MRFYDAMLKNLPEAQELSTSEVSHPEPHMDDMPDSPNDQYWMSKKCSTTKDLTQWLIENKSDRTLNMTLQSFGCH